VSYFQFTQSDVNAAKEDGKKDLARLISAIMLDAEVKMEDPDTYDRTYVMEDLLARLAATVGPLQSEPFETWHDHRLAYPEMMVRESDGLVRPFIAHHADTEFVTNLARDTERAIVEVLQKRNRERAGVDEAVRQTWLMQTFDGVRRHRYEGSYSGMVCGAMVERRGFGEDCGLPAAHRVHETEFPG
jgi:hypothetical protein